MALEIDKVTLINKEWLEFIDCRQNVLILLKDCIKWIDPITGMEFVYVSEGSFKMGSDDSDAYSEEKPVHKVSLNGFLIGRYPVTQEEWQKIMGSNPSKFNGKNHPVESVSWNDCQEFIDKLNSLSMEGKFSLPTEAQWEFAAQGGNKSRVYKYAGSDHFDEVAWYEDNSHSVTHDVGLKKENELGLCDMSGNVREWCQDWYDSDYYGISSVDNPQGPSSGSFRVLRGGSWLGNAGFCRSADRDWSSPGYRSANLGFRLVLSLSQQ